MSEPLSKKKRMCGGHQTSLKRLVQQVTDAVDDHAGGDPTKNRRLAQLKISVEDKLATLKNLDSEILDGLIENTDVSEDAIAEEVEQADAIKELAYGAIVAIDEIYKPESTVSLPSQSTVHTVDVKLPKLEIHPFDGNVTKWITFWDSFESAVDSNPRLSDIDKFNYLRSLLEKSAADAIAGLTLTAANYKEAVAILKKRFGNEQRIIDKHLETLMHLDAVTSQTNVQGLRKLYDLVESQVRGLKSLGINSDTYSSLISPVIIHKVLLELQLILSREVGDGGWKFDLLLTRLKKS